MLEGLFDPKRWEITFSDMSSFLDGFSLTLTVVLLGLAISLVLGCLLGVLSTTRSRILLRLPEDLPAGAYRLAVTTQCTSNPRPLRLANRMEDHRVLTVVAP